MEWRFFADRPVEESNNLEGDAFYPGSYWKLLDPSGPVVNKSDMNAGGVRFKIQPCQ